MFLETKRKRVDCRCSDSASSTISPHTPVPNIRAKPVWSGNWFRKTRQQPPQRSDPPMTVLRSEMGESKVCEVWLITSHTCDYSLSHTCALSSAQDEAQWTVPPRWSSLYIRPFRASYRGTACLLPSLWDESPWPARGGKQPRRCCHEAFCRLP